jgi:adenosylcobinamide hydrolase
MRYYTTGSSLFIRGSFDAICTGDPGGIARVSCLSSHSIPSCVPESDPRREAELMVRREGLSPESCFFLVNQLPLTGLCVFRYDRVTCFITAARMGADGQQGPVTIILTCNERLSPGALAAGIITVTEAKTDALREAGVKTSGNVQDGVIIASDSGSGPIQTAVQGTLHGMMREAVRYGTGTTVSRNGANNFDTRVSLFVYSHIGGGHWTEWKKAHCPYYPCHHEGQSCDFCYCPLYPCHDLSLGSVVASTNGGTIWNCSSCHLVHDPVVAKYLRENPMASLSELMAVFKRVKAPYLAEIPS